MAPPQRTNGSGHDGGSAMDPTERLKQLQIELGQGAAQLQSATKQQADLQADVDDLAQAVKDLKDTVSAYGAGLPDMEQALHALQYFYDQKSKMVEGAIGHLKGAIDGIVREYDEELAEDRRELEELERQLEGAREASTQAADAQADRQKEYDHAKAYAATTQGRLKELGELRGEITQADDANDVASMYFLVLEFKHVLDRVRLHSQHEVARRLAEELGELESAKENARAKKSALDALQASYDAETAKHASETAARRQHILDDIHDRWPVSAGTGAGAAAGAGAGAGTGTGAGAAP